MFSESVIADCITPLVQFSQPSDPGYRSLDSRLVTSLTGRTIEGVNALCTIENIKNSAPEFNLYNYPAWVTATAIKKGAVIKDDNILYAALQNISAADNTVAPGLSANYEATDPFNDFLYKLKYQAAIELVSKISNTRKLQETSKSLIENLRLYEGGGLLTDRIINRGAFVGFALQLTKNDNIINYLTQIGIQLDAALAGLNFYIFHESKADPIYTIPITATGGLNFNWSTVNNVNIKHLDLDPDTGHDTGGLFYIGYYQKDLGSVQAIERQFNISIAPCSACNPYNQQAYQQWSKHIKATAIRVDRENLLTGAPKMWDPQLTEWAYNTNWGINLAFSVTCDISNFICINKTVFADAYAKLVAVKCIELMVNCTRLNGIAATTKALASTELDPKRGSGSLKADYAEALGAIDFDISGFDRNCLACSSRGKINWGAL